MPSALISRPPGREKLDRTAENDYLHCGPNGAGHFVKMIHNRIEYSLMAAYAEGLTAWQRRPLADLDLVSLYLDGFHLRVRVGGRVSSVPILAVLCLQRSRQKVVEHARCAAGRAPRRG